MATSGGLSGSGSGPAPGGGGRSAAALTLELLKDEATTKATGELSEEDQLRRRRKLHEVAKAEGDEATRCKAYGDAETAYTRALSLDPTQHATWGNRSLVRLKLGDASGAASDAKRCTELAPSWPKGWARLGAAERAKGGLQGLAEAAACYRQAHLLEPGNKEFERLQSVVTSEHESAKEAASTFFMMSAVAGASAGEADAAPSDSAPPPGVPAADGASSAASTASLSTSSAASSAASSSSSASTGPPSPPPAVAPAPRPADREPEGGPPQPFFVGGLRVNAGGEWVLPAGGSAPAASTASTGASAAEAAAGAGVGARRRLSPGSIPAVDVAGTLLGTPVAFELLPSVIPLELAEVRDKPSRTHARTLTHLLTHSLTHSLTHNTHH